MNTKMKAIILAAGKSSRLYPITIDRPKCLLEIGGERIINRQINALRNNGINDIIVVVGYQHNVIRGELGDTVKYSYFSDYEQTNNLHTLWSVRDLLDESFVCLFSDVVFEVELIQMAKESPKDICLLVDTGRVLEGTMRVLIQNGKLTGIGGHLSVEEGSGNFIGIAKFSKRGSALLIDQMKKIISGHKADYYTIAIDKLAKEGKDIGYIDVKDRIWTEIDTKEDLKAARRMFF